ncbi:WhiB family transcriptional regulator [Bifidobacterium callitrichidarum]|uniref:Transcriptional regulator WhiB n=1 Tax=Bifidobacterium callitrichidarum TaxID=2052941 RepID=A0A2U2NCH1_9BIFI|nr:WhiB family transcriptional regulator [Bifidobacterium callitrichidarum]PWG66787.1 WhiB family transcriptional regulator [Bifidobacterium callitrichidarum]
MQGNSRWREQAACRNEDPELFFPLPNDRGSEEKAIAICETCPVKADCLQAALNEQDQFGIWGGLTAEDRRSLLRRRMRLNRIREYERRHGFRQTQDVFYTI